MRRGLSVASGVAVATMTLLFASCSGSSPTKADDPLVSQLSATDRALYEEGLRTIAEFWGVDDPPEYPVVRWLSPEEVDAVLVPCVAELGFSHDGVSYHFGDQKEAFGEAMYECRAKYPILPRYTAPWGDEQLDAQYEWTVRALIPCLGEHGYTIVDAPSRTVFIDTWGSAPFYPFAQLPQDADPALEQQCPQIAPGAVLYDGMDPEAWIAAMRG